MQACKLNLPRSHPSLEVTSVLSDPISHSLAFMHSDRSILLYASVFPFYSSSSPPIQTLIPPPSTSACFLRLQAKPNSPDGRVLFVVAGPHIGSSKILLRFWILGKNQVFAKVQASCSQNGLICDDKLGVVADLSHGFSVKLAASVNVLALYSLSAGKIWVLAAKTVGDEDGAMGVRLMKCAVIDCSIPVCSIFVSFGFLLLGEENGVRVFQLRPLVKGDVNKQRESGLTRANKNKTGGLNNEIRSIEGLCLQKGAIRRINGSKGLYNADMICSKYAVNGFSDRSIHKEGTGEMSCEGKTEEHRLSAKHRIVKLKQDSGEGGTCFVMFNTKEVESLSSTVVCIKAVSIHALSLKRFLILDSVGDLHLLNLSDTSLGSKVTGSTRHLTSTMKVQMLAVLPDISKRTQTVWISDGFCSVHMMTVSDTDTSANENDYSHSEENPVQISDIQAIFASEKIQDVIPLDTNAILVLGQGNIFAYAIS